MPDTVKQTRERERRPIAALPVELAASEADGDKTDLVSVLMFEIGGASYSIGVEQTEGVVDCPRITPLPSAPEGVAGLVSVRGKMTVVMDLSSIAVDETAKRRLILVKGSAQMGLLADRIDGVIALEPKRVRPIAHGRSRLTNQQAEFRWPATGYFKNGKLRVPIVDVEKLCEG